ncbi:HlyD family secretion protein [Rhodoferax antarcticus]|uniref:HlyD secretion family protein n=1 Tax=Rhodoferax antarcticus ANT.BR TaxID=1111071 RepID=A0A1Q8YJI0_9BURK|nr:HlyD family efflux transporter periplasmic adaptor subunit [Rhodoferax antarcticus]APW47689.1 efflux transporter periplasmic adaptor subunit [Rhodoferax antarcticus]OLP08214.1 hlyD secretion family protein [Rhodoferax antarcticus ANT.BR]
MKSTLSTRTKIFISLGLVAALGVGFAAWQMRAPELPQGVAFGNGRLEATEVDLAIKVGGRLASLTPHEGDRVVKDEVVASLDAQDIAAQLRGAEAQVRQAQELTREAQAGVTKAQSDVNLARMTLKRSQQLVQKGFISGEKLDRDRNTQQGADAGLAAARLRVMQAQAAVEAATARGESLSATVNDTALKAPITARVLYRLAEPGEVLAPGSKLLTLLDLTDVHMTIFLPTSEAGKVAIGSPARIVLDALPDQVLPATVTFVAPRAQFTPKEVETRSEREKLMFRVKVKVDAAWLAQHEQITKGGMPGMAYVHTDAQAPWPQNLQLR